jgi:hypothetical protein
MRARLDEGIGHKEPARLFGRIGRQRQACVHQMREGGHVVALTPTLRRPLDVAEHRR